MSVDFYISAFQSAFVFRTAAVQINNTMLLFRPKQRALLLLTPAFCLAPWVAMDSLTFLQQQQQQPLVYMVCPLPTWPKHKVHVCPHQGPQASPADNVQVWQQHDAVLALLPHVTQTCKCMHD